MKRNPYEELFQEEIREKKKTGRGAFSKKGKGVIHSSNSPLRSPYYFMTNKEKKNLDSEVSTFNMYEVLSKDEFLSKDIETQKMLLGTWRETMSNKDIQGTMGISTQFMADLVNQLDLPHKKRGGSVPGHSTGTKKRKGAVAVAPANSDSIPAGLELNYSGTYDSLHLMKILSKLSVLVENEDTRFKVTLSIKEHS